MQLVVPDLLLLQDPLLAESVEQLARVDARHRVVDQCVDEVREGHVHSLKQVVRGKQLLLRVQVVYDQLQEVVKTRLVEGKGVVQDITHDVESWDSPRTAELLETLLGMGAVFNVSVLQDKVAYLSSNFSRWLLFSVVFLKVISSDILLIH